jgi:RecA/RadA recombinase
LELLKKEIALRRKTEKPLEDQIKEKVKTARVKPQIELVSSGCDVLDTHIGGGFGVGTVVNLAGKRSTAKTLLILMHIAKCIQKYRDKFQWRYDDVESGMLFDTETMFGFPIYNDNLICSGTVEEFNFNFTKFCKGLRKGQRAVYVVDSLDMLPPQAALKRSDEEYKTMESGKVYDKGTYGKEKQMYLSANFFSQKAAMARDHNCILIFVSQLRANFDSVFGEKEKKGGGFALDHQNSLEIWLYKKSDISVEKEIRGIKRPITKGSEMEARVKKNKITGQRSRCFFSVIDDMGIDNVGSNVDYLYGLKNERGARGKFPTVKWDRKEFKRRDTLIKYIEKNNQEDLLIKEINLLRREILEAVSSQDRKRNIITA